MSLTPSRRLDIPRWALTLLLSLLGALVVLALDLLSFYVVAVGCSGDGGTPYAAPASPRGRFCAHWETLEWLHVLLPSLVVFGGILAARVLDKPRRRRIAFRVALVVALGVIVGVPLLSASLDPRCERDTGREPPPLDLRERPECVHY